jgi:hypothetical protein
MGLIGHQMQYFQIFSSGYYLYNYNALILNNTLNNLLGYHSATLCGVKCSTVTTVAAFIALMAEVLG